MQSNKNLLNYFIPFASHIDERTLLTKYGSIVQTIKITNVHLLGSEITGKVDIRAMVRQALIKHMQLPQLSIWLSTVRREVDLSDKHVFRHRFLQDLQTEWDTKNALQHRFANDLYISVVYQHSSAEHENFTSLLRALDGNFLSARHNRDLQVATMHLKHICETITQDLATFKPEILGIKKTDKGYVSSLLGFIRNLVCPVDAQDADIQEVDLTNSLSPKLYNVNLDDLDVAYEEQEYKAAVLSIKEYQELPVTVLHNLLGVDCAIIVTEILTRVERNEAMRSLKEVLYVNSISNDAEVAKAAGLQSFKADKQDKMLAYQQVNVSVFAKDDQELERYVSKVSRGLNKIGLVHIREDIDIEYAFWSRLPANYRFATRKSVIHQDLPAAFSCVYASPSGDASSKWGPYMINMPTSTGSTYFLNLHIRDRGHTLVLGAADNGKGTLVNFLLSFTVKYEPEVFYIASSYKANALIKVLGGNVFSHLDLPDPCKLLTSEELLEFLRLLCAREGIMLKDSEQQSIEEIVSASAEAKTFAELVQLALNMPGIDQRVKELFTSFTQGQRYGHLFKAQDVDTSGINLFDLTFLTAEDFYQHNYPKDSKFIAQYLVAAAAHNALRAAVMFLLFKVINKGMQNNKPKVVVLSDGDKLMSGKNFPAAHLKSLIDFLDGNNGFMLVSFDINQIDPEKDRALWDTIRNNTVTKMLLSSKNALRSVGSLVDLSNEEQQLYDDLPPAGRYFLLKQGEFAISTEINLPNSPHITKILSLDSFALQRYLKIAELKLNNEELLDKLYEAFGSE